MQRQPHHQFQREQQEGGGGDERALFAVAVDGGEGPEAEAGADDGAPPQPGEPGGGGEQAGAEEVVEPGEGGQRQAGGAGEGEGVRVAPLGSPLPARGERSTSSLCEAAGEGEPNQIASR